MKTLKEQENDLAIRLYELYRTSHDSLDKKYGLDLYVTQRSLANIMRLNGKKEDAICLKEEARATLTKMAQLDVLTPLEYNTMNASLNRSYKPQKILEVELE